MPEFAPGSAHIARVTMKNPSRKPWDYKGILRLGANQDMVFEVPFQLNAGESKEVSFGVVMPTTEGEYPVYVDVYSDDQLLTQVAKGTIVLTYNWQFSGGFSARCTNRFSDGKCYKAEIDWRIDGVAPDFRWSLIYWNYHYSGQAQKSGNGAKKGTITCSGGARLYAHPDPEARIGIVWTEGGLVVTGGFKLVASMSVADLW